MRNVELNRLQDTAAKLRIRLNQEPGTLSNRVILKPGMKVIHTAYTIRALERNEAAIKRLLLNGLTKARS